MRLRKILPALFICLFLFAMGASAKTLQLTIGDSYITIKDNVGVDTTKIDAAPFISSGRTLVPVRVIAESFGSKVGWDDPTDTVTITSGKNLIKLVIGSNTAIVNGKKFTLDVPANIYGDRTFVPIRFVTEALGYNVSYVDMTKDVVITDLPAIMDINGAKVTMETYNLLKYIDKYDFEGKTVAELVEYSKSVYDRIETAYKKYDYVFSKGVTLSAEKKNEIQNRLAKIFEDEDTFNSVIGGVYVSWEEKLAYAEIYDEKYAPDKQVPQYDEALIASTYKDNYYGIDYIKIGEKNKDNLAKMVEIEKNIADEGYDAVEEKCSADEIFTVVKNGVVNKTDYTNVLFDITIDLAENGISEATVLEDGYYIARRIALPEISEETRNEIIKELAEKAIKEIEEEFDTKVEIIITSDAALDLAE